MAAHPKNTISIWYDRVSDSLRTSRAFVRRIDAVWSRPEAARVALHLSDAGNRNALRKGRRTGLRRAKRSQTSFRRLVNYCRCAREIKVQMMLAEPAWWFDGSSHRCYS